MITTITEHDAYQMGARGADATESERLLFEAWMRGHCWAVIGDWNGKQYVHAHEANGFVHGGAMNTRRLWAAWRDRAALSAVLQPAQVAPPQYVSTPKCNETLRALDKSYPRTCDRCGLGPCSDKIFAQQG